MKRLGVAFVVAGMLVVEAPSIQAQPAIDESPALLIILDASESMRTKLGSATRIAAAKQALRDLVGELPGETLVGLRVFGHGLSTANKRRGCTDTRLEAPVRPLAPARLRARINGIRARGLSPIGLALRQGLRDLPPEGDRTIVVVADGEETCAPPIPCEVARKAREAAVRVDVVGFRVRPGARRALRCTALAGGGSYLEARSEAELTARLRRLSLRPFRGFEVEGSRVRGSEFSPAAPQVAPGTWSDTIAPGEDRWYRLRVEDGQTLSASATIGSSIEGSTPFGLFAVRIYGSDLYSPTSARGLAEFSGLRSVSVTATSPRIGDEDGFRNAGSYLVRLTLFDAPRLTGELPVQLDFVVEGRPRPRTERPRSRSDGSWMVFTALLAIAGASIGAGLVWTFRRVVST
ncbi:MAG: VWA domain-containing protein [Actinomycetota bacterium]|nr:VWA domain-containing protein [Actinomycetota bacterium]